MLPFQIIDIVKNLFNSDVKEYNSLSGGCINSVFKIQLKNGKTILLKHGSISNTDIFVKEANGLNELGKTGALIIPEVYYVDRKCLITQYIYTGHKEPDFYFEFGKNLAEMHKITSLKYGFYEDNFIGSNIQKNDYSDDWIDFYFKNRILYQFKISEKHGNSTNELKTLIKKLEEKISFILSGSIKPPALLHGDLWSGNFLITNENKACLIDPAVYYGDPEAELAMTRLFGGFGADFYEGYNTITPLPAGYEYREKLYMLYHVLNHFNMFGGSYYDQAINILKFYT